MCMHACMNALACMCADAGFSATNFEFGKSGQGQFMCVCVDALVCVLMNVYVNTCACEHARACVCSVHSHACLHVHVCEYTCMWDMHFCVCVQVHMCVRVHVCVCACEYTLKVVRVKVVLFFRIFHF